MVVETFGNHRSVWLVKSGDRFNNSLHGCYIIYCYISHLGHPGLSTLPIQMRVCSFLAAFALFQFMLFSLSPQYLSSIYTVPFIDWLGTFKLLLGIPISLPSWGHYTSGKVPTPPHGWNHCLYAPQSQLVVHTVCSWFPTTSWWSQRQPLKILGWHFLCSSPFPSLRDRTHTFSWPIDPSPVDCQRSMQFSKPYHT